MIALRVPSMVRSLWRYRSLVLELTKRDFLGRYHGSFGGVLWSFGQPLFLLAVYTVAFGVILQARWGFAGNTADYALMVFAGLIVFNAFSECLAKAPLLVTANPNLVKKVVFPLDLLPWVMALTVLLHAVIGIAVWLLGYIVIYGMPKPTVALVPAVLACLFPLMLGMGWLLAALGVVVRDISQLTALVSHSLLFLTPIFYSIDAVPAAMQTLLLMNPLTFVVEQLRLVLFFGQVPVLRGLLVYFALACVFAGAAFWVFRRMRPSFADMV